MRQILSENVYATNSAVWSYNRKSRSVLLLVTDSENMTNHVIQYKPHCKNYLKHRNRIKRIAG
jgi:hypothetical protein